MAARTPTVTDMTFTELARSFRLASYHMGERWCPAVFAKDGGYSIRVVKSETRSGANATVTYDYFELDSDGLVLGSPRGYAREYTKRVRVTNIAEVAKQQAVPNPDAPRFRLPF